MTAPRRARIEEVKRSGGPNVRFLRIKRGHTDTTEIDNANFTVNIVGDPIYSTMTGDWAKHIAPIVFKHTDRDPVNSPDQVKAWVKEKPGGWSPKSSLTVLKMLTSAPSSSLNAASASKSWS